jgi:hypothetical protein
MLLCAGLFAPTNSLELFFLDIALAGMSAGAEALFQAT